MMHTAVVALVVFLAAFPIASALGWIAGALVFFRHRECDDPAFYALDEHPFVSVLVAAHEEELVLDGTLRSLLALDWPEYEVVVVDDGSSDATAEIVRRHLGDGRVRLIRKEANEGKAMALNDALALLRGEIVLLVDADGRPAPDVLRWMVPHFVRVPRLAAVTGNPRVANTTTLLAKLQAIEFSATVSVLRRAQATWGRVMTFSGICTAVRRSAVEDVGRWRPMMATEDIALAWQLQSRFYDVRYEPRALFSMQVPETLGAWWHQRVRWGRGLGQVLRANLDVPRHWTLRRLWPVFGEAVISTLWNSLLLVGIALWSVTLALGDGGHGADPVPAFLGVAIAVLATVQIAIGLLLDGRYDPAARRFVLWAPLYPLAYWVLMAAASTRSTIPGFIGRRRRVGTWPDTTG
jgi:biofilm PGA synthesis N-glycosyltransferase PgaC